MTWYWPDWPATDPDYEPDEPDYDDRCVSCGAEVGHYLGCPDDPDPDYEAEQEVRNVVG